MSQRACIPLLTVPPLSDEMYWNWIGGSGDDWLEERTVPEISHSSAMITGRSVLSIPAYFFTFSNIISYPFHFLMFNWRQS